MHVSIGEIQMLLQYSPKIALTQNSVTYYSPLNLPHKTVSHITQIAVFFFQEDECDGARPSQYSHINIAAYEIDMMCVTGLKKSDVRSWQMLRVFEG